MGGFSTRAAWYSVAFVSPLTVLIGHFLGGWFYFTTPAVLLVLLPLLDVALGPDPAASSARNVRGGARLVFRAFLYFWVPVQLVLLGGAMSVAVSGELDLIALVGLVWSVGLCTGAVGITVAHELIHGTSRAERALGDLLLTTVCYTHFAVEHIEGHHRRVATPADPASATRGMSLYRFYPRSLLGGLASAWRLEADRIRSHGGEILSSRVVRYLATQLALVATMGAALGLRAVLFFLAQSVIAFSLLEVVNYIEHYGLERETRGGGKLEAVSAGHAWNANYRLSNAFLFGLQHHADHHMHPRRPYEALRDLPASPQLPAGYAGMIWLAVVPPLWKRVMDPRLADWQARQSR